MVVLWSTVSIGCGSGNRDFRKDFFVPEGCARLGRVDEASLAQDVRRYFHSEIGVAVGAVNIEGGTDCGDTIIFSIEAVTKGTPYPRIWLVFIDKTDGTKELIRPE
jgi:hypothetical protein